VTVQDGVVAAVFLGIAILIGAVGIRVGMLVGPWLERISEPRDEEPGDDD
jgi:hypothetical protein